MLLPPRPTLYNGKVKEGGIVKGLPPPSPSPSCLSLQYSSRAVNVALARELRDSILREVGARNIHNNTTGMVPPPLMSTALNSLPNASPTDDKDGNNLCCRTGTENEGGHPLALPSSGDLHPSASTVDPGQSSFAGGEVFPSVVNDTSERGAAGAFYDAGVGDPAMVHAVAPPVLTDNDQKASLKRKRNDSSNSVSVGDGMSAPVGGRNTGVEQRPTRQSSRVSNNKGATTATNSRANSGSKKKTQMVSSVVLTPPTSTNVDTGTGTGSALEGKAEMDEDDAFLLGLSNRLSTGYAIPSTTANGVSASVTGGGDSNGGEPKTKKVKSAKRREKDLAWKKKQLAQQQRSELIQQAMARNTLPCKFYQLGLCDAGDACSFSHLGEVVKVLCKYFQSATGCTRGDSCAYSHDPSQYPCFRYLSGLCTFESCKYSHEELSEERKAAALAMYESISKKR